MLWLSSIYALATLTLWSWLQRLYRHRLHHVKAQTITEFALILFLVGIVCIAIIGILGFTVKTEWWDHVITQIGKVIPIQP